MRTTETSYRHVVLDPSGVLLIVGTTMMVVELVLNHQAYGWSLEELHFQHPYLSLGQIYSTLAYYWDHKDELDNNLARRYELAEQIRRDTPPSSLVERIRCERQMLQ